MIGIFHPAEKTAIKILNKRKLRKRLGNPKTWRGIQEGKTGNDDFISKSCNSCSGSCGPAAGYDAVVDKKIGKKIDRYTDCIELERKKCLKKRMGSWDVSANRRNKFSTRFSIVI